MLKVALTGGIATGKSYVLNRFRSRGVPCLDADELAHGVMAAGTEASRAIAARFGADDAGCRRRGRSPRSWRRWCSPMRPRGAISKRSSIRAVYRAIEAGLRAFELIGGSPVAVVDVPLLYETGRAGDFDRVVATMCAPEVQLARLQERGLTEAEAGQRLAAQMPAAEKAARADYVIRTDGTFEETDAQVDDLIRLLLP